ncbi:MAG TPA: HNH endonuclease signature motif containing protein [Caulobacteraceae bacterium]|nr:HNH endonuclease signature motif containing protein [Caulobacteraceae bacterium]
MTISHKRKKAPAHFTLRQRLDLWSEPFVSGQCRLWLGGKDIHGYGALHFNGKYQHASRWAYIEHIGPIPEGMHVLHRCDNPPCINHEHLFLGTHADNMADMVAKGRGFVPPAPRGEESGHAILTEVQALEIMAIPNDVPSHFVGAVYGVSSSAIRKIRSGRNWAHL